MPRASTALEGNILTLGETAFVLREGLTIKGKPLKDHRDVEGHARAVDLMVDLVKKDHITAPDLFNLHRLVIDEQILDAYKPVGDWKKENNSTPVVTGGRQTFIEYSNYWEVPQLDGCFFPRLSAASCCSMASRAGARRCPFCAAWAFAPATKLTLKNMLSRDFENF
jgi:hypothetical protein